MKRWMAWLAVMVLCVCLTACGKAPQQAPVTQPTVSRDQTTPSVPPTPMALGETITADGYAELTLYRVETTQKIRATLGESLYYENTEDAKTYVDMVLDIVYLGTGSQKPASFAQVSATGTDGTVYAASLYAIESNNARDIAKDAFIKPQETNRYHAAVVVPEEETALEFVLTVDGKRYSYAYTMGERVCDTVAAQTGETLTFAEAELTLGEVRYADRVDPSEAAQYATYYAVDDETMTYLVVPFTMTNIGDNDQQPQSLFDVTAVYKNGELYTGFVVTEDASGQAFCMTDVALTPSETRTVYTLIEVPQTLVDQPLTLRLAFGQTEYEWIV